MSEPTFIPLIENRSAAETDDKCGMRYWFYQLEGGKGIVPKKEALALTVGAQTHEDLALIASLDDIGEGTIQQLAADLLGTLSDEDRAKRQPMELLYRRIGWFVAYALFIEPKVRAEWEDIGIERDIILDRSPLWVPTTPDRLLRNRKVPTRVMYREYKSTISGDYKWQQSWRYAIQLQIGMKAASEEAGVPVSFAQVVGLMKGGERDGAMVHPYVYGYYNAHKDEWRPEYQAGMAWVKMPVWEYPGGIVEWVKLCGREIASSQFPHSVPIFLDERMLNDWVARRTRRQQEIREVKDRAQVDTVLRGLHFERRTNQCRPPFGDMCPYLLPCWNAVAELDPMATGDYNVRTPHHEIEISGVK